MTDLLKHYEEQLLARLFLNKENYYAYANRIHRELFFDHSDLFEFYYDSINKGGKFSLAKMIASFPKKVEFIRRVSKSFDDQITMDEIIVTLARERAKRHIKEHIKKAWTQTDPSAMIATLTQGVSGAMKANASKLVHAYDIVKDVINNAGKEFEDAIPSGFTEFDDLTLGGLRGGDLIIMAAPPSMGKTALSLNIVENVVSTNKSALFITLEMTQEQVMKRLVACESHVPIRDWMDSLDWVSTVASKYKDRDFYIVDTGESDIAVITGDIRAAKMQHDIDLVVIDYLQLMSNPGVKQNREQEVASIARILKNLAKELKIPILLLCQLRRVADGQNPRPTLNRLRDSGQIEEAADIVWFIHRPEYFNIKEDEMGNSTEGVTNMIIAKGRNYGTTEWTTKFIGDIAKFVGGQPGESNGDLRPSQKFEEQGQIDWGDQMD